MKKFTSVEHYLAESEKWQAELSELREIALSSGLEESLKWSAPCYSYAGKNLVGIAGFKSYFGMWFFQGALLKDKQKLLIAGGEKTRAMRQMRFHSKDEINPKLIRSYITESIGMAKKGIEIKPQKNKPLVIPPELITALAAHPKAKKVFDKMSNSCQREYADYIATAKQDATKQRRLEKILPMIQASEGMHDKYRNC